MLLCRDVGSIGSTVSKYQSTIFVTAGPHPQAQLKLAELLGGWPIEREREYKVRGRKF
jgi:hypothetical protein